LKKIKLVQGYKDHLPGWKAHSLSIGGIVILINAIMAAKSFYFMLAFRISKGVIDELNRIKRRFRTQRVSSKQQTNPSHLLDHGIDAKRSRRIRS
jgi:hypothetical protein